MIKNVIAVSLSKIEHGSMIDVVVIESISSIQRNSTYLFSTALNEKSLKLHALGAGLVVHP